jgi:hypothetical protein
MFVRVRFPYNNNGSIVTHYLILKDFSFNRTANFDVYHLSQIFSSSPILFMIMGSQIHFNLSGNLFIKSEGSEYFVDGLYNASFNPIMFLSIPRIVKYFKDLTDTWNNGVVNSRTRDFAIEFVNNYNDPSNSTTIREFFLPENFSYSISNRDSLMINVSINGQIGIPISGG